MTDFWQFQPTHDLTTGSLTLNAFVGNFHRIHVAATKINHSKYIQSSRRCYGYLESFQQSWMGLVKVIFYGFYHSKSTCFHHHLVNHIFFLQIQASCISKSKQSASTCGSQPASHPGWSFSRGQHFPWMLKS